MTLFDRLRLLGHGIKLALVGLFLGYILISVILGVDVVIQHNSAEERGWLSRVLPDVLKYVPLILAFIGLAFPFLVRARSSSIHGSAGWATPKELARLTKSDDGLLIGRDPHSRRLLRHDGPGHLLTMAPTRTGKGVGTIIPNLLTANRSVICMDPKGENARITARARMMFGPVYVLDPFGITGFNTAAFNPLDHLDPEGLDLAEDAGTLADALVFDEPGMAGEAHWSEEAKALISGLILMIVATAPPDERHLGTLRRHLTADPQSFANLQNRMQQMHEANGLIARAANRHLGKADREAAGVLSAAQRHTHFLDSPRMLEVLRRSDFHFTDLKHQPATVFLVLPPDRLSTYSRWLRLLITQSLTDMARDQTTPTKPVLYLLDEFAALGHLAPIERAMGLMAGYGVQLWPILQDMHQLRATYGGRAGTFLSNASVCQVFGVNDIETASLIAKTIGRMDAHHVTSSWSSPNLPWKSPGHTSSEHVVARDLITPDEIMRLPSEAMILLNTGQRPALARKIRYHADPEFQKLFDQS
ncbi:type IV secretory system conjugative DNA transfer family protein [Rhizobium rhizophilum]|uniref:Type IV secretory system conjugative DNA transfer family protein n=1 Tax=Rhizobium rhizophilum TaxID=1850373 RepID=A0ABY2QR25_9HYPH|nr:type IV secretory system conjugative DNA transfer family protein [Rhizobium rhizophilum]THV10560.1 type IV secretory system conjugative DNA transfer family protein [Rhizobium rhizophilum]